MSLSQARVRELLDYDPETGVLTWRVDRTTGKGRILRAAGTEAGYVKSMRKTLSYRSIRIDRQAYKAHRLIWLLVHGHWPEAAIDHINCDGLDNRLVNLREATLSQNSANMRRRNDNTSGAKGVCRRAGSDKWSAEIMVAGKRRHLGQFESIEAAAAAYEAAAIKHFGEFARP